MAKKILIVDDEPDIVESIKFYLELENFECIEANDGEDALLKAKKENPDIILLDIMLPKMDGYKVCGLLKADVRYNKIPIILFTAKVQDADITLGKEVGADAHIKKPFEAETVLLKIKELIKD